MGFPHSSVGKESACSQETPVQFLGREDLLENGQTTHSSILAWRIPWTELDTTERLSLSHFSYLPFGLPWWLKWKRIHLQGRRPGFDPWVRKIP